MTLPERVIYAVLVVAAVTLGACLSGCGEHCRESVHRLSTYSDSVLCAYGAEVELTDDPRTVRCTCPRGER